MLWALGVSNSVSSKPPFPFVSLIATLSFVRHSKNYAVIKIHFVHKRNGVMRAKHPALHSHVKVATTVLGSTYSDRGLR